MFRLFIVAIVSSAALLACSQRGAEGDLQGAVGIDGSSTVFPITEAVAEEFRAVHPHVRVTIAISGTGGGFKKFCLGETDINDASRPIKSSEQAVATDRGVGFIELPIAYDGIAVVINPSNDFAREMTVAELKAIWRPGSAVTKWSDVRPDWPDRTIKLYGPGTDSGTFDYFTKAINGKEQACRADFTQSEDDNVLVTGVAGDVDAMGFFGFAYYAENRDRLSVVAIDTETGEGAVAPSVESINDGSYAPLSRPIFIYVRPDAAERPEVDAFVRFYLEHAAELAADVGYVALPKRISEFAAARYAERTTGTVFGKGPGTLIELMASH